ncbi:MAG: ABC transporter ATP-binding protein [Gammaproteobacteria bacterium]|jgi:ABC-2 type transport system ATP-binding protein|nr:ABC transporter ATP-binding protein [Gammaproteobacteria bacterium]
MDALLEARGLVKDYPGVRAVDGVSLAVPRGACFGLLGPNGAGKTTTLEMLEGITPPTAGEIRYKGRPLDRRYREEIGIQFQATALQEFQTTRESLDLFAQLYERNADLAHLIERCQLGTYLDRDTRKLSGGQRQRLLLAIALVNDPELVFLDEPTTGLDPQSRRNFWQLIDSVRRQGKTVLLTTHYMEEASQLCDTVAIVDGGRLIAQGAPAALVAEQFPGTLVRLPRAALPSGTALPDGAQARGETIELCTADAERTMHELLASGVPLGELQVSAPTLEDVFLALTGHGLRG